MTRKTFSLTYGTSEKTFEVDETFLAASKIELRDTTPMDGLPVKLILSAMRTPVNSPALEEMADSRAVGVVIPDDFRYGLQKSIFEAIVRCLTECTPKRVLVFCANGSHPPLKYSAREDLDGRAIKVSRYTDGVHRT